MFDRLDPEIRNYGNRFHLASIVDLRALFSSSSSSEASAAPFTLITGVSTWF